MSKDGYYMMNAKVKDWIGQLFKHTGKKAEILSLHCKQQEEQLRTIKISNEILESVVSAHNVVLRKMADDATRELSTQSRRKSEDEQEEVDIYMDRLFNWIDIGLKICSNITDKTGSG